MTGLRAILSLTLRKETQPSIISFPLCIHSASQYGSNYPFLLSSGALSRDHNSDKTVVRSGPDKAPRADHSHGCQGSLVQARKRRGITMLCSQHAISRHFSRQCVRAAIWLGTPFTGAWQCTSC